MCFNALTVSRHLSKRMARADQKQKRSSGLTMFLQVALNSGLLHTHGHTSLLVHMHLCAPNQSMPLSAKMQTVQSALDESTAVRPAGPALGTAEPANWLALAGTVALQCQPNSGNGWKRALQCCPKAPFLPLFLPSFVPEPLQNGSKLRLGAAQE